MRIKPYYVCELCQEEHETEEDARTCEARGIPAPMPFLPLGEEIPAFGENHTAIAKIVQVRLSRRWHHWEVFADPFIYLNHNSAGVDDWVPACSFDPRCGWDGFRYGCSKEDAAIWRAAMARYGFKESESGDRILAEVRKAEGSG
jgi:hypothetical protein